MDVKNVKNVLRKEKHMNKASKLLSLLLVLTIVFSLSVTALAADTYTITIKGDGSTADHTYEAYQIFSGDLHDPNLAKEENEPTQALILSNIKWGSGVDTTAANFKTVFPDSAAAEAKKLTTSDEAQAFAQKIARFLSSTKSTSTGSNEAGYTISGLDAGYYLVKDKDNTLQNENDFYTAYMMKVVGNVEATPKGNKPTLKKQIQDNNSKEWSDKHAGFQLGDTVNFRTISTVPSNIASYETYTYIVDDTMSVGFTFNNDVKIKASDGAELEDTYYTVTVDPDNTNHFTVSVDIKAAIANGKISTEQELYVYYSAILNEKAQFYFITHNPDVVNTNTASLTYSNNPNGEGTGKTPDSTVTAWTYPAIVNKVDGNGGALTGAKFVVSRTGDLDVSGITINENGELAGDGVDTLKAQLIPFHTGGIATYEVATDVEIAAGENITYVVEAGTYVSMAGFGEHSYYLYEIKAPAGFNRLSAPVKFTVNAPKEEAPDPKNNPAWLTINDDETHVTSMEITVKNQAGATLPETGGIGTTLFYVIGALLVVGAGVLLVTKKRMGKADN